MGGVAARVQGLVEHEGLVGRGMLNKLIGDVQTKLLSRLKPGQKLIELRLTVPGGSRE